MNLSSPEEMLSPFDSMKETDAEGREWWNSRKLAQLNNGGYRHVKSMLLSRTACLAISLNADKKKPVVKAGILYGQDDL